MDFALTEEQTEARDLADRIFADRATTERVKAVESGTAGTDGVDTGLWASLADAGLLGIALPEEAGGAGLGLAELGLVLEAQGRHVAPVPVWPAAVAAATVAAHGGEGTAEWVQGTADGSRRLTVALEEYGPATDAPPATTAEPEGGVSDGAPRNGAAWRLTGVKAAVPSLVWAEACVVTATGPDGPGAFLVRTGDEGVRVTPVTTTSRSVDGDLHLEGAPALALGPVDGTVVAWVQDRARTALAALAGGVADGAMRAAASYLSERQQFGRPLATFQAVAHQLADCWIDVEAQRLTALQAAWLLDEHLPTGTAVDVAAWWAADAGQRVVHRVIHLHGGMGVDIDYPVHRYLLWGKQITSQLGGASARLTALGDRLAVDGTDRNVSANREVQR